MISGDLKPSGWGDIEIQFREYVECEGRSSACSMYRVRLIQFVPRTRAYVFHFCMRHRWSWQILPFHCVC